MTTDFLGDLGKAMGKQWDRSMKEIGDAFSADLDSIVKKTENEGFLQGALEAADTFSPGNVTVELLDGFNVIPEDPGLKEMISGGVNFVAGAMIPGAGLPLQLMALKDGFDAVAACTTPPSPAAVRETRQGSQVPMSPKEALKCAKERAKHEAIEKAKHEAKKRAAINAAKVEAKAKRSGYADDGCCGAVNRSIEDLLKRLKELFGDDKTQKADDEIQKLLKNMNGMCFEDFIFALLRAVLKQGQSEVKALGKKLSNVQESDSDKRRAMDREIKGLRNDMQNAKTPEQRAKIQTKLDNLLDDRSMTVEERMESRAELAEQLKNAMQKLSEMQQAMSNILNTQHETAMAAIRNIR